MFTGLIEQMGRVVALEPRRGSSRIEIASPLPVGQMEDGESVAVDGVCLTVSARRGDRFEAVVVAETLSRSTLGQTRVGHAVNLERALCLGDRLGGHLVQGHVDTTAAVAEIRRRGDDWRLRLTLAPEMRRYVAEKGSVALQGVSLTVSGLQPDGFEVALVPQTLARTTLGQLRVGQPLNLEVDLLARYLERLMGPVSLPARRGPGPGVADG